MGKRRERGGSSFPAKNVGFFFLPIFRAVKIMIYS